MDYHLTHGKIAKMKMIEVEDGAEIYLCIYVYVYIFYEDSLRSSNRYWPSNCM